MLVWEDKFDDEKGFLDLNTWERQHGIWTHGRELQVYTTRPVNSGVDGQGNLVITAQKERFTHPRDGTRDYTSARLHSKKTLLEGYYGVVAKVGLTTGTFPAIWTLGQGLDWPDGGEIDILECVDDRKVVNQAIHCRDFDLGWGGPRVISMPDVSDAFHEYGVYFDKNLIAFYIDRKVKSVVQRNNLSDRQWPFGRVPQYLVLNIALGLVAGDPNQGTYPQQMIVKHVFASTTVPTVDEPTPTPVPTPEKISKSLAEALEGDFAAVMGRLDRVEDYTNLTAPQREAIIAARNRIEKYALKRIQAAERV